YAWRQARHGLRDAAVARRGSGVGPDRPVKVGMDGGEGKIRRHDADDLGGRAFDDDFTADRVRTAAEATLPKAVTEDGDRRRAYHVVRIGEDAANHWRHAQDFEETC